MISHQNTLAGACIDLRNAKVDVHLFAAAIEKYLEEPGLVEQHSATALKAAGKFTMKSCIDEYLEVFAAAKTGKIRPHAF